MPSNRTIQNDENWSENHCYNVVECCNPNKAKGPVVVNSCSFTSDLLCTFPSFPSQFQNF